MSTFHAYDYLSSELDKYLSSALNSDDEYIIYGYLREHSAILALPTDLWHLIFLFYHLSFEEVQFSAVYKSYHGFRLVDNNKCAKRVCDNHAYDSQTHQHKWIIAKDPVFEDTHCWRVFIRNNLKQTIVYAISEAFRRYDDTGRTNQRYLYGFTHRDDWYYGANLEVDHNGSSGYHAEHDEYQCKHFNEKSKMCVDILLDADEGTVEFSVVQKDQKKELFRPKLRNLPPDPDYGYVPYFNCLCDAHTGENTEIKLRLVKIDPSKFGIYQSDMENFDWFEEF